MLELNPSNFLGKLAEFFNKPIDISNHIFYYGFFCILSDFLILNCQVLDTKVMINNAITKSTSCITTWILPLVYDSNTVGIITPFGLFITPNLRCVTRWDLQVKTDNIPKGIIRHT